MMAVLKRELKAYFTSVIGWIFLAAFFFVFNLYFVANNLITGLRILSYSLSNVAFVLVIIIPILTMRSMAEDRRTKTDQLLYTAPVSYSGNYYWQVSGAGSNFFCCNRCHLSLPVVIVTVWQCANGRVLCGYFGNLVVWMSFHRHLCFCFCIDRESGDRSSTVFCSAFYRIYDAADHRTDLQQ